MNYNFAASGCAGNMNRNGESAVIKKDRPQVISIKDLKEGMKFDAPVYFENDNLFVEKGIHVRARDIRKLGQMGITTVFTLGNLIRENPSPAKEHTTLHLFYIQAKEIQCLKEYTGFLQESRALFSLLNKRAALEKKRIDDLVNGIFRRTKENPQEMIQIIHGIDNCLDDLAVNALHTAIISIVMGIRKKLLSHDIITLATAGLLHDIGMLRIPEDIRGKKGKLSDKEINAIRTHSSLSHDMIRDLNYSLEIAGIVLAHHERWDGQGYPKRLSKTGIPQEAQIISVAAAYAALINAKPYRNHFLGYDAVKTILHGVSHQFKAETVRLFLKSIGIYPLGSVVVLNNFSIGRVVETHEDSVLRPRVEIFRDKYGEHIIPPHVIDLVEQSDLYIMKAIDPRGLVGP
jgi:HD-GYP domain-containing protein (c-di-GMP phosphodiesterase class II)